MTNNELALTNSDLQRFAPNRVDRAQFAPCEHPCHGMLSGDEYHPDVYGELRINPYVRELDGIDIEEYLCDRCYDELLDAI